MKLINSFLVLLFFSNLLFSQNEIAGKWLTEDKEAIVQITEAGGKFYGTIVWLKAPNDEHGTPFTDDENPDKTLRNKPLIGLQILKKFEFKDNEWIGGTIYDPSDGKTYSGKLWIEKNNTLRVRGYIAFLHETETWTKAN